MNRLLPPPTGAVRLLLATAVLISLTLTGCATQRGVAVGRYDFFARSEPATDPWHDHVAEWQERARKDHPTVSIEPPTDLPPFKKRSILSRQQLRALIGEFEVEQRHELARRISKWTWLTGRFYYVPDEGEASTVEDGDGDENLTAMGDYWPTYSELMDANSSDCDGLDLLAYQLLREFGFPKDQLFRAILLRHRDNANHMVTLWFEDPGDPWVFDATGAATRELVRFSEVQGWTPTNVFNETAQYTVVERNAASPRGKGHPFAALSPGLSPP
jgi:hypothetical protein